MINKLMRRIAPALLVAGILGAGPVQAQTEKAKLVLPAVSVLFSPIYIAQDAGYFKEAGVDIELGLLAGPAALNALIGGSAEFSSLPGLLQLRAAQRGQKTLAIGGMQEVATSEIVLAGPVAEKLSAAKTPEERVQALKGLTLAVDAANGLPHAYLRYLGRQAGLDVERDVRLVFVAPPAMNAALERKEIDGFVFSSPFTLEAIERGAQLWVSGPGGDFPELTPTTYNVLVARDGYCEKSPQVCSNVLTAIGRGMELIHSDPDKALAIIFKRFEKSDPELLAKAFASFRGATPRQPMPLAQAFDHTVDTMFPDTEDKAALKELAKTLYSEEFLKPAN